MSRDIKIFVVNLARADARKKAMEKQLNNIDVEFFIASDGRNLNAEEQELYQKLKKMPDNATRYHRHQQKAATFRPPLQAGEIGCYLSHYRLLQKIVTQNIEYAVILEDDIILQDDWYDVVKMLTDSYYDWEIVRLYGIVERRFDALESLGTDYQLVKLNDTAYGTQAYMVTQQGAKKLLNLLRFICMPVDVTMDYYWQEDIAFYAVQPYPIALNETFDSMIDETPHRRQLSIEQYEKRVSKWQRCWFLLLRFYLRRRSIIFHRPQIRVSINKNQ
ncbi:MAG: glycosyltransferase family 25 protein [Alphaproteobacteria bacterium]|nr:glycosyltransferase family 25 protein [Alphaproteobacteria bacterium]